MYVTQNTWLEYGPARRRACPLLAGMGLGDALTVDQLNQTANNPSWQGQVQTTIGSSQLQLDAYPFLTSTSGVCVFGADPSNPNCLSSAGQASAAAAPAASAAKTAASSNLLYIGLAATAFIGLLALVKR